jgi:hypothetical protein
MLRAGFAALRVGSEVRLRRNKPNIFTNKPKIFSSLPLSPALTHSQSQPRCPTNRATMSYDSYLSNKFNQGGRDQIRCINDLSERSSMSDCIAVRAANLRCVQWNFAMSFVLLTSEPATYQSMTSIMQYTSWSRPDISCST